MEALIAAARNYFSEASAGSLITAAAPDCADGSDGFTERGG